MIYIRYHYTKKEKKSAQYVNKYKDYYCSIYICDHPLYDMCTLIRKDNLALAIIQQYFLKESKATFWSNVSDEALCEDIVNNEKFDNFFIMNAKKEDENGLYPTFTLRQIMWNVRMKPLKKERWETAFDHYDI